MSGVKEWEQFKDEHGRDYYYNHRSGETSWDRPSDFPSAHTTTARRSQSDDISPSPLTVPKPGAGGTEMSSVSESKSKHQHSSSTYTGTTMNAQNVPKGTGTSFNWLKISIVVAILLLVTVIIAVTAYELTKPSSSSSSPPPSSASASQTTLAATTASIYDPNTRTLSLSASSTPGGFSGSQFGVLASLFTQAGGLAAQVSQATQATNNLLQNAGVSFTNVLPVDTTTNLGLQTLQQFGVNANLLSIIQASVASKTFVGTYSAAGNVTLGGPIPSIIAAQGTCIITFFFGLNETSFTSSSVQFAIQCSIDSSWQPSLRSINGLLASSNFGTVPSATTTTNTWLSDFKILANASLILSTIDATLFAQQATASSTLPPFLDRGLTISAFVTPVASATVGTSTTILGGIDSLLTQSLTTLPGFELQFSLPLNLATFNVLAGTQQIACLAQAPRGMIWFPPSNNNNQAVALKFNDGSFEPAAGASLTLLVSGWSSSSLTITFGTTVNVRTQSMSTQTTAKVLGTYTKSTNALVITGVAQTNFNPTTQIAIAAGASLSAFASFNSGFSLSNLTLNGTATFSLSQNQQQQLKVQGIFTNSSFLLAVVDTPVTTFSSAVTTLTQGSNVLSASTLSLIQQQLPSLDTGIVTITFSTFTSPLFSDVLQLTVNPGLSFTVRGLSVNAGAFGGVIAGPLSQFQPQSSTGTTTSTAGAQPFAMQSMSFTLTLPLSVLTTSTTAANAPIYLSLTALNVQILDFTLSALSFNFVLPAATTASPSINWASLQASIEAAFSINVPLWSSSPLTFHALATYTPPASATNTPSSLVFVASLSTSTPSTLLHPFGWTWLSLSNTLLSVSVYGLGGQVSYNVALTTQATFSISSTTSQPIPLTVSVVQGTVTLSARAVSIASVYPELAAYVGVLATTPVDIILTTANASNPLTVTPVSTQAPMSSAGGMSLTALSGLPALSTFASYIPSSFSFSRPGFNLIASHVSLNPSSGLGGTLSSFSTSSSASSGFNLTVSLPFSLQQVWTVDLLMTGAPVQFSSTVSLTNAEIQFAVQPSPLSVKANVVAGVAFTLPGTSSPSTLSLTVGGNYSSLTQTLNLYGSLSPWGSVFGLPWLSLGQTSVLLSAVGVASGSVSQSSYRALSLQTTASFNGTVGVSVCGALVDSSSSGAQFGLSLSNIGVQSVVNSICQLMGVCGLTNAMLNSINFGNAQLFLNLGSSDFALTPVSQGGAYALLCPLPAIRGGISIGANINLQGLLLSKLQAVWPNLALELGQWVFSAALPFNTLSHAERLMNVDVTHVMRDTKHPALAYMSRTQLLERQRFLSTLSSISSFSLNFVNNALTINLTPNFQLQGLGVVGTPFGAPPTVNMFISARLLLANNPSPLFFSLSGDIGASTLGVQVTLTGTLLSAAWVNPFGIRGLIVHSVGASVGVATASPVGIASLGLGFSVLLNNRINLAFSGNVDIGSIAHTYVTARISSTNLSQPLALIDFVQAAVTMSGGLISSPPASLLPPASVLSLSYANFSLATQAGVDLNGNAYSAGLSFAAQGTVFGIMISVSGSASASGPLSVVPLLPVTDFVFNFNANLAMFNEEIITWLISFIPFDPISVANSGTSLCTIACVNSFSLTGLTVSGLLTSGALPSFSITISIAGTQHTYGPTPTSFSSLVSSPSAFFNAFKADFAMSFCVVDANCPSGQVCDHTGIAGQCVAGCAAGYTHVPLIGCVKNLFLPLNGTAALIDPEKAAANYIPPPNWWLKFGCSVYDNVCWTNGLNTLRTQYYNSLMANGAR